MEKENEDHKAATAFVKRVQATATEHAKQTKRTPAQTVPAGITINRPSRCTIVIGGAPQPKRGGRA